MHLELISFSANTENKIVMSFCEKKIRGSKNFESVLFAMS